MIGQPGVTLGRGEEAGGVGHQVARLVGEGDGGGRVGRYQSQEEQEESRREGLAGVETHCEGLWLHWQERRKHCITLGTSSSSSDS